MILKIIKCQEVTFAINLPIQLEFVDIPADIKRFTKNDAIYYKLHERINK